MARRLSRAERAARLDFAAETYTRTLSTRQTQRAIQDRFGLRPRQARTVLRQVFDALREEAAAEGDPTLRRMQIREAARLVFELAMAREAQVMASPGTPLLHPTGHERAGELVTREDPDLRAAMRALDFLARLDGVDRPAPDQQGPMTLADFVRLVDEPPAFSPGRVPPLLGSDNGSDEAT